MNYLTSSSIAKTSSLSWYFSPLSSLNSLSSLRNSRLLWVTSARCLYSRSHSQTKPIKTPNIVPPRKMTKTGRSIDQFTPNHFARSVGRRLSCVIVRFATATTTMTNARLIKNAYRKYRIALGLSVQPITQKFTGFKKWYMLFANRDTFTSSRVTTDPCIALFDGKRAKAA